MSGRIVSVTLVAGVLLMAMATLQIATAGESPKCMHEEAAKIAEAVKKAMGNVKVKDLEQKNIVIRAYEVEVVKNGKTHEILVTADGQILEIESKVEFKDTPLKVAYAIKELAKDSEVEEVDRVERHATLQVVPLDKPQALFEGQWHVDGKEVEILVDVNGNVVDSLGCRELGDDDDDHEHKEKGKSCEHHKDGNGHDHDKEGAHNHGNEGKGHDHDSHGHHGEEGKNHKHDHDKGHKGHEGCDHDHGGHEHK